MAKSSFCIPTFLIAAFAGFAFLAGPLAADAQDLKPSTVLTKISAKKMLEILKAEGYGGVSIDEDGDVLWKLEGYKTFIIMDDSGESVQFRAAFSDVEVTLRKVNDWNKTKKFSRTYLDDDGDPVIELDLDFAGGVTIARVIDFVVTSKISFKAWLDEVIE